MNVRNIHREWNDRRERENELCRVASQIRELCTVRDNEHECNLNIEECNFIIDFLCTD